MRLALLDHAGNVLVAHTEREFREAVKAAFAKRVKGGWIGAESKRARILLDLDEAFAEVEADFKARSVGV